MLGALLNRLRPKGPPPQKTPPPRRAAPTHAPPLPAVIGARRPLVSAQGKVAGFEFHAGAALTARLGGAAAAAYAANLLGGMRLCASQGLNALAELPAGWLQDPDALPLAPGMYLLLRADAQCADPAAAGALVARLRAAGVHVGWDPRADTALPGCAGHPDFVPLRVAEGADADSLRSTVQDAATRWRGTPLLLDLPSVELLEAALGPPVLWATFTAGNGTEPPRAQSLPPQARHMLRLLDRLLRDDAHAAVVDDIKADAALGLRLLQYLNSAGAAQGRELASIEQAVLLLGRDALYRWVAQMVVRMAPPRPAAHALQATALARARLFEHLAGAGGEPNPGGLYLLGLATMLPLLLQCSLDEATQALQLPAPAVQALRREGGPWQPYLTLLQALEAADLAAIDDAAAHFGGRQAVMTAWAEAWQADATQAPPQ